MKRVITIILTSTILLTGCIKNDKRSFLEHVIRSSKELIAKEEFEQAKGLLEYVSQNGGSNLEGYSSLSGQLDRLLLAKEYYQKKQYDDSTKILKELFEREDSEAGVIKGVVSLGKKIEEQKSKENNQQQENTQKENTEKDTPISSLINWDNVFASSELTQNSKTYKATNVIDKNKSTSWIEGVAGDGIGQYIEFSSKNTFRVDKINIINGLSKSEKTYKNNNRIKKVLVEFSDKTQQVYELKDNNMNYQTIDVGGKNTNSIKITIQEVYTESRIYQDSCISEIAIYGQKI